MEILGCSIGTLFILHNISSYKKKKFIYTIPKYKYEIVNEKYFNLQVGVGVLNSLSIIIISLLSKYFDFISSKYALGIIIIFWTCNYSMELYAKHKKYIELIIE